MSAQEPEILEAEPVEPEMKVTDRRHGAIAKRGRQEIAERAAPDTNTLISQAMTMEGLSIEERLMLIDKVESITVERQRVAAERAFYDALAEFQHKCPVIKKTQPVYNKNATTVRYYYAPLGQIIKQVGPILAECGLSFDFSEATVIPFEEGKGGPFFEVTTNVHHRDGHSRGFPFRSLIESNEYMTDTQHGAEANTYAKRYGFCNAFGVVSADEDFDGNPPERITPNQGRDQRREPVSQPKPTPTAQRAAAASADAIQKLKAQIHPAVGKEPTIEQSTISVITKNMEDPAEGGISMSDFKKRFPAFVEYENPIVKIKPADMHIVMAWLENLKEK